MAPTTKMTAADVAASIDELPAMPASISEVIIACDDQDMTVGQLSQVILRDQALTANILKLAHSAFYGNARRVTTVTEAIVLLGLSAIKSLAISSHTARLLDRELQGYGMARGELWRHSLSVAFTARRIAIEVRLAPVEEAFVAGLLVDIGKVILSSRLEEAFEEVSAEALQSGRSFHEVEHELLGFDHAELGAMIAAGWGFPPELEDAIRYHHDPAAARVRPPLAACVHIADAICMMLGVGLGADGLTYAVHPEALATLGLTSEHLVGLMDEVAPLIEAVEAEQAA